MVTLAKAADTDLKPSQRRFGNPGGSLGLRTTDLKQFTRKLKRGLPYRALTTLQKNSGLSTEAIAEVVQIPRRTLARRKAEGRLTSHESERLLRLGLVFERTLDLFEGDGEAARQWLRTPAKALGNETPLTMTETELGAREVEDLIGRLEHGVFA